jgi:hypothetical protein
VSPKQAVLKTFKERALALPKDGERVNIRAELDRLDTQMNDLRVQYEQYFIGVAALAPDKPHAELKRLIRTLRKLPHKNSEMNYRLRSLESRYNTLNTYWQRVLREREEGRYSKDLFRADLKARLVAEEEHASSAVGAAERSIETLFNTYKSALEKQSGQKPNIELAQFQESIVKRAKALRDKHKDSKISFKVVVKEGQVTLKATVREGNAS